MPRDAPIRELSASKAQADALVSRFLASNPFPSLDVHANAFLSLTASELLSGRAGDILRDLSAAQALQPALKSSISELMVAIVPCSRLVEYSRRADDGHDLAALETSLVNLTISPDNDTASFSPSSANRSHIVNATLQLLSPTRSGRPDDTIILRPGDISAHHVSTPEAESPSFRGLLAATILTTPATAAARISRMSSLKPEAPSDSIVSGERRT